MRSNDSTDELSAQMVGAKERSRQRAIAQKLIEAGLIPEIAGLQFVSSNEVQSIMDRAHESKRQTSWLSRSDWKEILPELENWLNAHDPVVSGLTGVLASGTWFAERVQALQCLWRDLYFYSPDGLSGYLVNHDSERGFETITW